jgi:ABC-type multidrug transport system fused ATPase/permease subunit
MYYILPLLLIGIGQFLNGSFVEVSGTRLICRAQRMVFTAIMRQDSSYFDEQKVGEITSLLSTNVGMMRAGLTSALANCVKGLFQTILGMFFMIRGVGGKARGGLGGRGGLGARGGLRAASLTSPAPPAHIIIYTLTHARMHARTHAYAQPSHAHARACVCVYVRTHINLLTLTTNVAQVPRALPSCSGRSWGAECQPFLLFLCS